MSSAVGIPPDTVIGQKYRINRKIGSGSFGEIYSGTVIYQDSNQQVAIKFEKRSARCPQLRHEFKVYRELQGCTGIGRVMYFGTYRDCNVMVMELLGPSLEDLFNQCGRRFSLKTTLQLADQLLERAETLHENHLIHRDIKPANFVVSPGDTAAMVFCIDFGLSKRYRHPHTLQHIPYREGRSLTGTPRYASVANHQGVETSRRDDLESIGYILVYFLLGKLPWQGLKVPHGVAGTASQKHRLILDKKTTTPLPELCRGCPVEFQEFIQYCRELQFDAKPNMTYVRNLFRDLYRRHGFENPKQWDWDTARAPSRPLSTKKDDNRPSTSQAVRPGTAGAVARPGTANTLAFNGRARNQENEEPQKKHHVTIPRPQSAQPVPIQKDQPKRPGTAGAVAQHKPETEEKGGGSHGTGGRTGQSPASQATAPVIRGSGSQPSNPSREDRRTYNRQVQNQQPPRQRSARAGDAQLFARETASRPKTAPNQPAVAKQAAFWGASAAAAQPQKSSWRSERQRPRSQAAAERPAYSGYVMDTNPGGYDYRQQRGSSLYQQNAILQGASGLMRHRRSSARERAAQQAGSFRPSSGGYGYGSYGNFGGQQQPSIWGHQPPRGSSGYQPRAGAARPTSAARKATRSQSRSRSRGRY